MIPAPDHLPASPSKPQALLPSFRPRFPRATCFSSLAPASASQARRAARVFIAQPPALPLPSLEIQRIIHRRVRLRDSRRRRILDARSAQEREEGMEKAKTRCELCGGAAAVHCAADSAFLCLRCDARVHGANFLASRHRRRRLSLDLDLNLTAEPATESSSSSASSSSCVSTADSAESTAAAAAPASGGRRKQRAEAVLEGWAKRMGFGPGAARRRAAAAATALRALGRGVAAARVPLRVAMAAALWSEISSSASAASCCKGGNKGGGGGAALLCRLEATAHVPARLVVTVASWIARTRRPAAAAAEEEEGWAECSS